MAFSTSSIYVGNLPRDISETSLINFLIDYLPEFFAEASHNGNLDVKVFQKRVKGPNGREDGEIETVAVVSGASVVLNDLLRAGRKTRLGGRFLAFKYDLGLPRDEQGEFGNGYNEIDQRRLKTFRSANTRRCELRLRNSILTGLNGSYTRSQYVYVKNDVIVDLDALGGLHVSVVNNLKSIKFQTCLEALQCIIAHNGTTTGCLEPSRVISFVSANGGTCNLTMRQGLGRHGQILNLQEIQTDLGYIPFIALNSRVFDLEHIRKMAGKCAKCLGYFRPVGVDIDCAYIATKCENCSYETGRNFMEEGQAFAFANEQFTRHTDKMSHRGKPYRLDILFGPMKFIYNCVGDFRSTVEPIVYWEWKQQSMNFTNEAAFGKMIYVAPIGTNEYVIWFRMRRSSFWRKSNYAKLWGLQLDFSCHREQKSTESMILLHSFWMQDEMESNTCLFITTVKFNVVMVLSPSQMIHVIPQPDPSGLESTLSYLKKWKDGSVDMRWEKLLISPVKDCTQEALEVPSIERTTYLNAYQTLCGNLNQEQILAVENAIKFPTSMCAGGPGTGKSYICGIITFALSMIYPNQKTALVGPTNEVCDNLCRYVDQLVKKHLCNDPPLYVLRIYSKKEEMSLRFLNQRIALGAHVHALHELVDLMIEADGDEKLLTCLKQTKNGGYFSMSTADKCYWDAEVDKYEQIILQSKTYNVIVTTISTLIDSRFKTENPAGENRIKIDTLMLDNAEFVTETNGLPLLDFGQVRLVLCGDDRQAKPQVLLQTADMAGYGIPLIMWLRLARCNIPCSTLRIQYRMPLLLCKFVSDISYVDMPLFTHASIFAKEYPVNCPILFIDHKGKELREHPGFVNKTEAVIIADYCNMLLGKSIEPSRISVVTFYVEQKDLIDQHVQHLGIKTMVWESMIGVENDFCVISGVRHHESDIAFDRSFDKFVMLSSRAKIQTIIVLNRSGLNENFMSSCKCFMYSIKQHGKILNINKALL